MTKAPPSANRPRAALRLRRSAIFQLATLSLVFVLTACDEPIVHHLTETDANRLVTHLADSSISARKLRQADGSWALSVKSSDQISALRTLGTARLLRAQEPREKERGSFISGRDEQRFRHERALSSEIERTLATIPSVLESRVHLNLPVVDPLFGQRVDKQEGSASVVLVTEGKGPTREEVASIVSGASGIPLAGVTVVLGEVSSRVIPVAEVETLALPVTNPEAQIDTVSVDLALSANNSSEVSSELRRWLTARETLIQLSISLIILGVGLGALVLRRRKPSEEFRYEGF